MGENSQPISKTRASFIARSMPIFNSSSELSLIQEQHSVLWLSEMPMRDFVWERAFLVWGVEQGVWDQGAWVLFWGWGKGCGCRALQARREGERCS